MFEIIYAAPALYQAAQLDPSWLDDPDRQVGGEVLKHLWREAVLQTGDRDLGLHIGEAFDLASIGIVGYVLLNCKTYRQILEKLSQYTHLFSQGVAIHHHVSAGWVHCDCDIVGNVKNYLLDEPRHPIESTFAALITATQQLTGNRQQTIAAITHHLQGEVPPIGAIALARSDSCSHSPENDLSTNSVCIS